MEASIYPVAGCPIDRQPITGREEDGPFCLACEKRYPPALLKAVVDPFNYALRLTTGELVWFESARIEGNWATLRRSEQAIRDELPYPCPRGVDVRVDQIVWVADAPEGS